MGVIQNIKLTSFRCYKEAELSNLQSGFLVFCGPNGAGKTNILEAVSLLSPGKGLRNARLLDLQKYNSSESWAISARVMNHYGEVRLGTGLNTQGNTKLEKRLVRINGQNVKSQSELSHYLACIWLTPQMDRLFIDSSRERRRFLDRLVFSFDPGHSGRVLRYENILSQRSKLLRNGCEDRVWLDVLEQQLAEAGVAVAIARLEYIDKLKTVPIIDDTDQFPLSSLKMSGSLEDSLRHAKALEAEDFFRVQLRNSRVRDALTGGACIGPHRSDLSVMYVGKNIEASMCSTGEQKALLIGLVLAHTKLVALERGYPPLLLLDEVAAHLDEDKRDALYRILGRLGGQVWLTGTEDSLFESIKGFAQFFHVNGLKLEVRV